MFKNNFPSWLVNMSRNKRWGISKSISKETKMCVLVLQRVKLCSTVVYLLSLPPPDDTTNQPQRSGTLSHIQTINRSHRVSTSSIKEHLSMTVNPTLLVHTELFLLLIHLCTRNTEVKVSQCSFNVFLRHASNKATTKSTIHCDYCTDIMIND